MGRLQRKARQSARRETFIPHIGILYERICRQLQRDRSFQNDLIRFQTFRLSIRLTASDSLFVPSLAVTLAATLALP